MKTINKLWVVEAHDLGALQVRAAADALAINRKRWMAGREARGAESVECGAEDKRAGKADRLLVGIGESIEEALDVERELKRLKGCCNARPHDGVGRIGRIEKQTIKTGDTQT